MQVSPVVTVGFSVEFELVGSAYLEGEGIPTESFRTWGAVIVLMISYDNIAIITPIPLDSLRLPSYSG